MRRVPAVLLRLCAVALFLFSVMACEQAFTTSWFGWARTAPSSMSDADLDRFAREALRSGDDARMSEALDELAKRYEDDEYELDEEYWPTLLDLGFAVSGVSGVVLAFPEAGDDGFGALEEQILAVDEEIADATLGRLGDIDPEAAGGDRFLYGALAAVFRAVQEADGWEEVSSSPADLDTAAVEQLDTAQDYADEAERLLQEEGKMNELREELIEAVRDLVPDA